MKIVTIAAVILAAVGLTACVDPNAYHPPEGQKVYISQRTFTAFKEYEQEIGSTHPGAFAVSKSGRNSFYFYCPESACVSASYGQVAVRRCNAWGDPCYVFATNTDVHYEYEVLP